MAVYTEDIAFAQEIIAEDGQSVIWKSLVDKQPVDSSKPWLPSDAIPVEHTVSIVFMNADRVTRKFIQSMSDTEVSTGSLIGLMGQVDFTPSKKDVVVRNGKQLVVETIDTIEPNDEGVILYLLEFGA